MGCCPSEVQQLCFDPQLKKQQDQQIEDPRVIDIQPSKSVETKPETKLVRQFQSLLSVDLREYGNLLQLYLGGNQLRQIDLSHCPFLTTLHIGDNQLQQINLTNNKQLIFVYLFSNQLQKVDVRANVNLTHLRLHNNQLQEIDVRANVNLSWLSLYNNSIFEIDLSKNTKLEVLWFRQNRLAHMSLWIAENVQEESYNNFDLCDQQTAVCLVQLVCEGQAARAKANRIAEKWKKEYSKPISNVHDCEYVISVV